VIVGAVILAAVWVGFASVMGGGLVGAILGAIVGTLFPVRRGPR
jgi:hypothetical protein